MNLLLTYFFSTLVTVAVANEIAIHFFLYWKYSWIDMPIHFLGGVSVALGISILPFLRITLSPRLGTFFAYVTMTFTAGVAWEVFEFTNGITKIEPGFYSDTFSDLCMDILGGAIGYGIVRSTKQIEHF